jgi:hypothetical protein
VPKHVWKDYKVLVTDPQYPDDLPTVFQIRAVSETHAEKQAKDGYTGLLGGESVERTQERLVVHVQAA